MFGTNPAALLGTSWCPLATAVCNPPDNGSIAALLLFLRPELWRLATVAIQLRSIRCCPIVLAVSQRSRDSWPATCRVPHYRYSAETLSGAHGIAHSTQLDWRSTQHASTRAITETAKCADEQRRLGAQAEKCGRNLCLMVVISMVAGAASFGAGAAFMKLLIG